MGGIQDFRSIRFMRMFMTGFEAPTVLRFAQFDLVRNSWQRYNRDFTNTPIIGGEENTEFNIDAVNIEENSRRQPFNYVLPNGIRREQSVGVVNLLQNEQFAIPQGAKPTAQRQSRRLQVHRNGPAPSTRT